MSSFKDKLYSFFKKIFQSFDQCENKPVAEKLHKEIKQEKEKKATKKGELIFSGQQIPIDQDVKHDLTFPSENYRSRQKHGFKKIVLHWDVALNVSSQHNILKRQGLSTHYGIDNDGTIYQFLDPGEKEAWHVKGYNDDSIGIDLSNAFYMKYQKYYEERFKSRPIVESSEINGSKVQEHLGFYQKQIASLASLIKEISDFYKIPLETPSEKGVIDNPQEFAGVMHHYQLDSEKIDCHGLDISSVIKKAKETS